MTTATTATTVGHLLRRWRKHRRRSQLDVALAAGVSARHLSFLETGRASPSREMIERLCDELEVPLRERNAFHLAGGFAPPYAERAVTDLGRARAAIDGLLTAQEPNPTLAVNVRWELLAANRAMEAFLGGVDEALLTPPVNVLRLTLHPDGLGGRIRNYATWRDHVVRRVRRQHERTAAAGLSELLTEIESYPVPATQAGAVVTLADNDLVVPLVLDSELGELSLLYTLTVFGAPRDVTLDEIAIETFLPADAATAERLRQVGR